MHIREKIPLDIVGQVFVVGGEEGADVVHLERLHSCLGVGQAVERCLARSKISHYFDCSWDVG